MDLFEATRERYSYRGPYRDDAIPEEHLRDIVQAGLDAPSGCNFQTTEFVIVTDRDKVAKIAEIVDRDTIAAVPAVIVVLCDMEPELNGMKFWVEDCSAATENVLLAITALGYASCWIDGVLRREGRAGKIAELLAIPPSRVVRIVLPVGVPAEEAARKEKRPFAERAWFNAYGG